MDRRRFLRLAGSTAGTAALGAALGSGPLERVAEAAVHAASRAGSGILDHPAPECPIDTVVVVMMENRSFDHFLGWLADDRAYLEAGRRRYGKDFTIGGRVRQTYTDAGGHKVTTRPASSYESEKVETRGCSYRSPGHNWTPARIQRDQGFVAAGTGNDEFALSYYTADDLPLYAALARRFTVFDRWHSSLLASTFPNRQYLFSAQSEGLKHNIRRLPVDSYRAETIWDRLARAGVPARYFHTDIPLLAMWGQDRMAPFIASLDRYFEDAAAGTLPNVAFVEPGFLGPLRTDDHASRRRRARATLGARDLSCLRRLTALAARRLHHHV